MREGLIHIAGLVLEIGPLLRQRCAWCGTTLLDYDLSAINVPEGQDPRPATWEVGALVCRGEGVSHVVDHEDGDPLPEGSCALLDPAVTA